MYLLQDCQTNWTEAQLNLSLPFQNGTRSQCEMYVESFKQGCNFTLLLHCVAQIFQLRLITLLFAILLIVVVFFCGIRCDNILLHGLNLISTQCELLF